MSREPQRCEHPACGKYTWEGYCSDHKPVAPTIGTVRGIPAVSALTVRYAERWRQSPEVATQYNRHVSRKATRKATQPTVSAAAQDRAERAAAAAARTRALMDRHAIGNDGEAG